LWFIGKICLFIFGFIWLRGTLPRYRYDQFMRFGWKILIPVSIVWILIISLVAELRRDKLLTHTERYGLLIVLGLVMVIVVGVFWALDVRREKRERELEEQATPVPTIDPFAGGHPVPPLPGQTLLEVRPRRRQTVEAAPVTVPAISNEEAPDA
jgi:NADH-quinone oxidoreductase subunit H